MEQNSRLERNHSEALPSPAEDVISVGWLGVAGGSEEVDCMQLLFQQVCLPVFRLTNWYLPTDNMAMPVNTPQGKASKASFSFKLLLPNKLV